MRMYMIKVLHPLSKQVFFEYASIVHPIKGEVIEWKHNGYVVTGVSHILKTGKEHNGEYTSLDHVQIEIDFI